MAKNPYMKYSPKWYQWENEHNNSKGNNSKTKSIKVNKNNSYDTSPKGIYEANKKKTTTQTTSGSSIGTKKTITYQTPSQVKKANQNKQNVESNRTGYLYNGKKYNTLEQMQLAKANDERAQKRAEDKKKNSAAYRQRQKALSDARNANKAGTATEKQKKLLLSDAQITQKNNPSKVTKEQQKLLKSSETGEYGNVARSTGKQIVGSLGKFFTDAAKALNTTNVTTSGKESNSERTGHTDAELRQIAKKNEQGNKELYNKYSKIQEQGEKEYQKSLDKANNKLERGALKLENLAINMAPSIAIGGPLGLIEMGVQSAGSELGKAKKNGATDGEDRARAYALGTVESLTELLGGGIGPARRFLKGGGKAVVDFGGKVADKAAKKFTSEFGKTVAPTVAKWLVGIGEENLEEIAAWAVDPIISNAIYGNKAQKRKELGEQAYLEDVTNNFKDNFYKLGKENADAVVSKLNSEDFINEVANRYMEEGASKEDALKMADIVRNYIAYDLSGDSKNANKLKNKLVEVATGINPAKETWSFDELKETLALTTAYTGIFGAPGTVLSGTNLSKHGKEVKSEIGDEGINELLNYAMNTEDEQISIRSQSMKDYVQSGKGELSDYQVGELSNALNQQYAKDKERQVASARAAQKLIIDDNSISPVSYNENGDIAYIGKKTAEILHENNENVSNVIEDSKMLKSLPEEKSNAIGQAVSNYMTGVMTVGDANELTATNVEAREVFELATGEKLPVVLDKSGNIDITKTNTATKEYLFQNSAINLSETAKAETANFENEQKPMLDADIMSRLGSNGQVAYQNITSNLDIKNTPAYMVNADAIATYYSAGRNSTFESFEELQKTIGNNPILSGVSLDARKQAFNAGLEDKYLAASKAGEVVQAGQNIKSTKSTYKGKGEISVETENIKQDDIELFTSLAKALNVNIHIVDNLPTSNGRQANGIYKNGEIWLNVNEATDRNIGYVFMHEVTHYIKDNAPEQYNVLEQMVRNAWFEFDNNGMQQAIKQKIDLYKNNGQKLTEAEAMEEILADATYEMLNDAEFVNEVVSENQSLGRAILEGIRSVLRKLRELFAMKGGFTPRYNAGLLSTLDILKEAEQLWLNALHVAAKNSADGFIAENNGEIKLSINENFISELDEWYDKYTEEERLKSAGYFIIGRTPNVLNPIGIPDTIIKLGRSKAQRIMIEHSEVTIDKLKEVVKMIESPMVVMQSRTKTNSIVLYGEVYSDDGKPIMASLKLDRKTGDIVDLNFGVITSAYARSKGKNSNNADQYLFDNSKILYVNPAKEKTDRWLSELGLQLPSSITNYGYIDKISYYEDIVKSEPNNIMAKKMKEAIEKKQQEDSVKKFSLPEGYDVRDIEDEAEFHIEDIIDENNLDISLVSNAKLYGSRMRGDNRADSDIDIVIEYDGDMKEYELFNILNEKPFTIGGIEVDINPIRAEESGTIDEYMTRARAYTPENRFSLSEPVEEKGDLVAIHNLREDNLRQALELGGFAMPSIAVVKAETGHDRYGEYSAVFNKETIAPELNRNNKVYGGDAWTPTYPRTEYKVNSEVAKKVYNKVNQYVSREEMNQMGYQALDEDNFENTLNRSLGGNLDVYRDRLSLLLTYLREKGIEPKLVRTTKDLDGFHRFENDFIIDFINDYGEEKLKNLDRIPTDEFRDEANKIFRKENDIDATIYTEDNFNTAQASMIHQAALKYINNGLQEVLDESNSIRSLREQIDKEDYDKWFDELFDGIIEKKGFRNNQDLFTPLGNRRSWEVLHDAFTLENVIKQMKSEENGDFWLGQVLKAVANKEYKTINEIKKDSDRLVKLTEEEVEELNQEFSDRFFDIYARISNNSSVQDDNPFIAGGRVRDAIVENVRAKMSKEQMLADFKKHVNTDGATIKDIDDIFKLVADIANAPTEYFEAKPQRAVTFDEINTLIAPDNAPKDMIEKLENQGVNISMYKAEDESDRLAKLNSIENVKFSISEQQDTEYLQAVESGDMGKAQQMVDEAANISMKKSKIRDSKGNLLNLYNGTKTSYNGEKIELGYSYKPLKESLVNKDRPNIFGYFFTDNEETAREYSKTWDTSSQSLVDGLINSVYLDIENPLNLQELGERCTEKQFYYLLENNGIITNRKRFNNTNYQAVWKWIDNHQDILREQIESAGYDGVIFDDFGQKNATYIAFNSSQIKLADPVTYDDNGSVIPLSERFNTENEDIRYSLADIPTLQQEKDNLFKYENEVKTLKNYVKTLQERKNTEGVSDEEKKNIDEDIYRAELMIAKNETLADEAKFNIEIYEDSINNFNEDEDRESSDRLIDQALAEMNQPAAPIPTEDEVIDTMAEDIEEYDANAEMPYTDQLLDESRKRRINIRDEVKSYGEKKHKDTVLTHDLVLNEKSVSVACLDFVKSIMQNSEYVNTQGRKAQYSTNVLNFVKDAEKKMFAEYKAGKYDELWNTAFDTAAELHESIDLIDDDKFNLYKDFRDYFRANPIYVPESLKNDFSKGYDTFYRANLNRLILTNNPANPTIDMIWQDVVDTFGGIVEIDLVHPADMLEDISNTMDSLEDYKVAYESEEAYAVVKSMAEDLLDICMDQGESWRSFADRKKTQYDEQTKRLKERHKEAIRDLQAKEKQKLEKVREYYKGKIEGIKNNAERKEINRKLGKELDWMSNALLKPTDNLHIPAGYDSAIAQLLASIDRQSERSKKLEEKYGVSGATMQLLKLKSAYEKIAKEDDTGMIIDDDLITLLDELGQKIDNKPLRDLTNSELDDVYQIARTITYTLRNRNKMFAEGYKEDLAGTIDKVVDRTNEILKVKNSKYGKRFDRANNKFTLESMAKPGYMFEFIGGGLYDAYMGIRLGMDQEVRDLQFLQDKYSGIFQKYFNRKKPGSDIEAWRKGKETIDFTLESGEHISITPAQAMSLYATNLREAAWDHLYKGGVCFTNNRFSNKAEERLKERIMITPNDVANITKMLTPEQKNIADALLNLLHSEPTQWANEISMKLYNYEKYTEENYYPMTVQSDWLSTDITHRDGVPARLKNPSFSKALVEHASNPLVIDDMFSVVTGHLASVLLYHSYAIPVTDFLRVYNYKYTDENGGRVAVKELIRKTFGEKSLTYINHFLNDVNGMSSVRKDGLTELLDKSLTAFKRGAVGANPRVILQQPMSVARAWITISPKYFVKMPFVSIKKNFAEMVEHCPIAWWKAQNHSDINMGHSLDEMMMNRSWSKWDVLTFGLASQADNMTWAWIWSAVKKEVKANNPGIQVGTPEFWKLCNERASYIFDQTQVVDSVLHRSDIMRHSDLLVKSSTSFMAEPTTSENMLVFAYMKSIEQLANGDRLGAFNTNRKAVITFALNAAMVGIGAALWDAIRDAGKDDDDKEKFLEHVWENFMDNLNPLNLLPFFKDAVSVWQGWDVENLALKVLTDVVKAVRRFYDEQTIGNAFEVALNVASYLGIPAKTIKKDIKAIFKTLGIEVNADDLFSDNATDEEKQNLIAKTFGGFWSGLGVKNGSGFDNFLNHFGINLTDAEKAEREFNSQLSDIQAKIKGMNTVEKNDTIWDMASEGYTKAIEAGDFETIDKVLKLVENAGGDTVYARERIVTNMSATYKKTIGTKGMETMQTQYRDYMQTKLGVSDQDISDICYSSETGKKLKAAFRINDYDMGVEALRELIKAGITKEDFYKLYENRNRGDVSKYLQIGSTGSFIWPCSGTITSNFGYRNAPTSGASSYHEGIDIGASYGSNVGAADGGRVTFAGYNGGYGYQVQITHEDGTVTYYSHLSRINCNVGDTVAKSQSIGNVGSSGTSTGAHLDFKIKKDGKYIDPAVYLS